MTVWRIRDRATFDALRRSDRRARRGAISVVCVPGDAGDPPRVACAVPKAVGNAVMRNRLRRRLRSICGDLERAGQLPEGAYLLVAKPEAAALPHDELTESVTDAVRAVTGREAAR